MFACNNILFYCKGYIYGDQEDLEKDHVILNVESLMELVTQTMLDSYNDLNPTSACNSERASKKGMLLPALQFAQSKAFEYAPVDCKRNE